MSLRRLSCCLPLCVSLLLFSGNMIFSTASAQEIPRPTREHEFLKKFEGTWDAAIKMEDGDSKGKATYKMELGGLWLIHDFVADFGGLSFQGKGLDTYDAKSKKYISIWIDSMSTSPMRLEGTVDESGKRMTMVGEGPGPDGKVAKYTSVTEFKSNDLMVFTLSAPGPDGKEQAMMTVEYRRKK